MSNELTLGSEVYESQRRIIDSMYRLDSSFARELIKKVEERNGAGRYSKRLVNHLDRLEIGSKIKNNKSLDDKEKVDPYKVVSAVVDALKAFNSDKTGSRKISELARYLPYGNKLTLHQVFPVFIYLFNNWARTYKSAGNANSPEAIREIFKATVKATELIPVLSQKKKSGILLNRKYFIDEDFASNKPVKPNSREQAFKLIRDWIANEAEEFLIIADPFFKKEDLEILRTINDHTKNIQIDILGSEFNSTRDVEVEFQSYWREITDEDPPFVNINFCKIKGSGKSPFHDRWMITKNSGLRLGTSINSLGVSKESEISIMKPNEALKIMEETLLDYVNRRKREFNGQILSYKSFSL